MRAARALGARVVKWGFVWPMSLDRVVNDPGVTRRVRSIRLIPIAAVLALLLTFTAGTAGASPVGPACDQQLSKNIPARADGALTGTGFAEQARDLAGPQRDALVSNELLAGNVPSFLRHLEAVTVRDSVNVITVCVLPDYLALGTDRDFVFVPLGLDAALEVAERFGFMLPTRKIVNAIYAASTVKLDPQPLPAGDEMRSTAYLLRHNEMIRTQRAARGAQLGALTAGNKKDLVLTPRLWQNPGRVAIYGWHRAAGAPIQPLSTVHGASYADYSHGIRLVSEFVYVNGVQRALADVLADPRLAGLLSDEGPLPRLADRLASLLGKPGTEASASTVAWLPRQAGALAAH